MVPSQLSFFFLSRGQSNVSQVGLDSGGTVPLRKKKNFSGLRAAMSVPELSISLKTQFSGALDSTPYRGQREGDNLYRVGPYCFTNRIKITAMQQTLRGEGSREIYTYKKEGGAGTRKGINELGIGGENDERKREKENPWRTGKEKGGGIFVEGKKGEYGVEVKE
jgi:hypothetical protein